MTGNVTICGYSTSNLAELGISYEEVVPLIDIVENRINASQ